MSFYTGFCDSFTDMKSALISCCQSNGWTHTTDSSGKDVIYKGNLYIMLESLSYCFRIIGRTGISTGSAPGNVGITDFNFDSYKTAQSEVQFPVRYFCFTYSDIDEIYFLINYADIYQWIAFGKATETVPGTGLWFAGTASLPSSMKPARITISTTGSANVTTSGTTAALFWFTSYATSNSTFKNYWLHSNIDSNYPWSLTYDNYTDSKVIVGIKYLTSHLQSQPNEFNQQSLLLPVLMYKLPNNLLLGQIQKARHIMINYLDPETIIYHGDEQWMVFPYFRKVYQSPYTFNLNDVDHTGNFGWAIKKEA